MNNTSDCSDNTKNKRVANRKQPKKSRDDRSAEQRLREQWLQL